MTRLSSLSQGARATIAVLALYALVLQAFFAGVQPLGGPGPRGLAELCAPSQDGDAPPAHHERKGGCCTAACAPLAVPLPRLDVAAIAWPPRPATPVVFSEPRPASARAPPLHAHSARGPPPA